LYVKAEKRNRAVGDQVKCLWTAPVSDASSRIADL
jgi:hypothetical protein